MITPPLAWGLCRSQHCTRMGWTHRLDRGHRRMSTFFHPFLFVFEPSLLWTGRSEELRWHFARTFFSAFYFWTVGLVGFAFGPPVIGRSDVYSLLFALAYPDPPMLFRRRDILEWIGLGGAGSHCSVNRLRRNTTLLRAAPKPHRRIVPNFGCKVLRLLKRFSGVRWFVGLEIT